MDANQNRMADYADWDFPSLAYLWDSQIRAIMAGAQKLDSLSEADFECSLALLADRVRGFARAMDDNWLVVTAYVMAEDLFKSYFNQFGWGPPVEAYIAATAGELMKEFTRRGFVLHYVVDNTLGAADLREVLTFMPPMFEPAGLAMISPQLMAAALMIERVPEGKRHLSLIKDYRDEGHAQADELVSQLHRERRSSFYLNMDFDDDNPALSMDVALSQRGKTGTVVVFRNQLPIPGSKSDIWPPPGIELPGIGRRE